MISDLFKLWGTRAKLWQTQLRKGATSPIDDMCVKVASCVLRYIDSIEDDGKLEVCHKLTSALSAIMECVMDEVLQARISDVAFH